MFVYDNQITHPGITQSAAGKSYLNNYLIDRIGSGDGLKKISIKWNKFYFGLVAERLNG